MRRVGFHLAHWQRQELFELCLRQLRSLSLDGWQVEIGVAGPDDQSDRAIAERYGCRYVAVPNRPLGRKCNAAVSLLRDCDALIGLGTDDLICNRAARALLEAIDTHEMSGLLDLYIYDLCGRKLYYWPGYSNHRKGETAGPGRCVRASVMERLNWEPFDPELNCSLDRSMFEKLEDNPPTVARPRCDDERAMLVDVKTQTNLSTIEHVKRYAKLEQVPKVWQRFVRHFGPNMTDDLHEVTV